MAEEAKEVVELKFTEEELNKLRETRNKFNQHVVDLGNAEIQLTEAEDMLDQLKKRRQEILNSYQQLKNQEAEFSKQLTEKYGVGTVDIDTGKFVPAQ